MATLHDKNTVHINARTHKTDPYINYYYTIEMKIHSLKKNVIDNEWRQSNFTTRRYTDTTI